MTGADFVVLHVEDDPNDVFFLAEAFKSAGMPKALRVARDGEEAVAYLLGRGANADRSLSPWPSLILLDLKLPRMSGLEFLAWRRGHERARRVPVAVLTSSQSNADRTQACDLGANSYLVKPLASGQLLAMVQTVLAYWRDLNKTPDEPKDR